MLVMINMKALLSNGNIMSALSLGMAETLGFKTQLFSLFY